MNMAKDNKKLAEVLDFEGHGLLNTWLDDAFPEKLAGFMQKLMEQKMNKKSKAKL
jgi:hypothetical protein